MTIAALRTRMRRIAAAAEDESGEGGELNLVPFLDIITNVLLFLFATVSFTAAVAAVPASAPAYGDQPAEAPRFQLALHLSDGGFTVGGSGDATHPERLATLPPVGGEPDYAGLSRVARELKTAHPEAHIVQVTAQPGVPYESVIGAIDAVRGTAAAPLFTDPLLAAGLE